MNYSKEIKSLKSIIQGLQVKQDEIEEKVSNREDVFNDKTEKWQESQPGLDYQQKTEFMDDQCSELANMISDFEMHLETLEGF